MGDVNINLQCAECSHPRGVLYYANPLAWGRPCRQCRRMMSRNVVVVPTQVGVPVVTTNPTITATATTTTTTIPVTVSTY
ncbi:uncharacterized protein LOC128261741 [Drosophila gunungcola]|uniref:Uncharacterized protein n=1 Tax=Drosophila gunungcola TaxID=103775 RepID=A0A9Q0BSW7_9MUSC|nr:uncharacterized protein LOC128261741 [Drosophila gunungcola]KAI8042710.1 hypothetical protein M5D96_004027 [Drosophila gunungcola]